MSGAQKSHSKQNRPAVGPIALLSGGALAAAALAGGLWLGGAFGSGASSVSTSAPGRVAQAPAQAPVQAPQSYTSPAEQPAAAQGGSMASGDGPGRPEAPPPHDGGALASDAPMTAAQDGSSEAPAEAMAAPAVDPADLYQVTYSDHEPQALTAAAEGKLGTPALVMFHADWCHVCQEVMPTVHQLREQYKGELAVVKVNVDQRDPAMANFPVRGTPTFVLFDRHGQALKTQSGWPGEGLMAQYLDSAVAIQ
jgi:thioredoxin 1